jgi:tetratricopeptide (TPR) repeat protein
MKKVAGEILWVVLKPPQPVPSRASNGTIANHRKFLFDLTSASIESANMLATLYSDASRTPAGASRTRCRLDVWLRIGILAALMATTHADVVTANATFAARAEQIFLSKRARFQTEMTNAAVAWQFGRACFDWAEFAKNGEERETIAQQGIKACRQSLSLAPTLAPGHYYLALNLGQSARTKTLGALRLVEEMERELTRAITLDAKFDQAGPHRTLGLLYFEAPGWPTSIGSRSKARQHLEKAVELAPAFPENHLCLLEAYLKWGEKKNLDRGVEALKKLWSQARDDFSGADWEQSWADWDERWKRIQTSLTVKPSRPNPRPR